MIYLLKKKINRKIKELKEHHQYIRFYKKEEPVLLVNLPPNTKVRTYLNLIFRLREQYDYPIVLKFSVLRYLIFAKWFKELEYIYFSNPFKNIKIHRKFSQDKKTDFDVSFDFKNIYQTSNYNDKAIPYIMHPANYTLCEPKILTKKIGIILSGNFEEKIYNTEVITKNFKILNRWQIYNEVLNNKSVIQITGNELKAKLSTHEYLDKMVVMKWQEGAISIKEWRSYLSASKFLFCAPGMTMPMCHNVLEAMSVGVVPILNYENWLNPSLEDKVNCLVFKTTEDISNIIDFALKMSTFEYETLQKNVVLYYEKYYRTYNFEENRFTTLILLNEDIKDLL